MYQTILDTILPEALLMGVDYGEFWNLCPKTLSPFIKAFKLKSEIADRNRWELGLYIKSAIGSSMSEKVKYPERPFYSTIGQKSTKDIIKDRFLRDMARINSNLKEV